MTVQQKHQFTVLIAGLKLRYFTADELLAKTDAIRNGVQNATPPESLWPSILQTAVVADEIRHRAGSSITILSGYRSPAYNKAVGGEPNSFHMRFMALDITCPSFSAERLHKIAQSLRSTRFRTPASTTQASFIWNGGLGLYVRSNFIHIDCRSTAANWKGN